MRSGKNSKSRATDLVREDIGNREKEKPQRTQRTQRQQFICVLCVLCGAILTDNIIVTAWWIKPRWRHLQ